MAPRAHSWAWLPGERTLHSSSSLSAAPALWKLSSTGCRCSLPRPPTKLPRLALVFWYYLLPISPHLDPHTPFPTIPTFPSPMTPTARCSCCPWAPPLVSPQPKCPFAFSRFFFFLWPSSSCPVSAPCRVSGKLAPMTTSRREVRRGRVGLRFLRVVGR